MPKRYCAMEYEASEGNPTTRSMSEEADRTERITTRSTRKEYECKECNTKYISEISLF